MSDATLPAPPHGALFWSIVTLAKHLCVAPAAVDSRTKGSGVDLHTERPGVSYEDCFGDTIVDRYLHPDAAERIASELPAGILARRVLAEDPEMAALLGWDQIYTLARHIVEMGSPT